jgi:cell wall-associated NlpC family hydrolase
VGRAGGIVSPRSELAGAAARAVEPTGGPAIAIALAAVALGGCGASAGPAEPARPRSTPPAAVVAPTTPAAPARRLSATARRRRRHVAPLPPPVADPAATAQPGVSPGAPTDAQVRRELERALGYAPGASTRQLEDAAQLTADGLAAAPPSAPNAVEAVIRAGNRVAHAPYVYGGGHGTWIDTAYDCSGSVSFALAAAGLLSVQLDSSRLARWGQPGPGRWITVYANAGHAFMVVAGLRFDTSGRGGDRGSRWQTDRRSTSAFTARHPLGL